MIFIPVGNEEVEKIVTALNPNKSNELDGIFVKILKSMLPVTLPHLTGFLNFPNSQRIFSNCLKTNAYLRFSNKAPCLR